MYSSRKTAVTLNHDSDDFLTLAHLPEMLPVVSEQADKKSSRWEYVQNKYPSRGKQSHETTQFNTRDRSSMVIYVHLKKEENELMSKTRRRVKNERKKEKKERKSKKWKGKEKEENETTRSGRRPGLERTRLLVDGAISSMICPAGGPA